MFRLTSLSICIDGVGVLYVLVFTRILNCKAEMSQELPASPQHDL